MRNTRQFQILMWTLGVGLAVIISGAFVFASHGPMSAPDAGTPVLVQSLITPTSPVLPGVSSGEGTVAPSAVPALPLLPGMGRGTMVPMLPMTGMGNDGVMPAIPGMPMAPAMPGMQPDVMPCMGTPVPRACPGQ